MKTCVHFWPYLAQFFSEWEVFRTKIEEKIKTHILCSIIPPPPEYRDFYETALKNIVEPDRL
jgi:hypothetical protein